MATVRLRCISPIGARDLRHVAAVARIVEVGEEIDVPADIAGATAGIYRPLNEAELAAPLLGGLRLRGGDAGPDGKDRPLEVRDPGSGLLAQPEHWELVETTKPTTTKK